MKKISCLFFSLSLLLCSLSARAAIAIDHWVTPTGTKVYFVAAPDLPILDMQIDFAAGSVFDPPTQAGLADLTRSMMDLGAGKYDETAISEAYADLGAERGGGVDKDRSTFSLRTLSDVAVRNKAVQLLETTLRSPKFDAKIFDRERKNAIAGLEDSLTRPAALASRAFWQGLYPTHPYGYQPTAGSLKKIQSADLQAFYRRYYHAANAHLTLVGAISKAEAVAIALQISAALPTGKAVDFPPPSGAISGGTKKIPHSATQAHILIGQPSIARSDPDFFALRVGNYILGGGGFVSHLVHEVREKKGFAYSVYSYFSPMKAGGPFQIGLQTKRDQADEAIALVNQVLRDFLEKGLSASELSAAKANLSGSFPLGLDSNKKILSNVANIAFYDLPLDYLDTYQQKINAVSLEEIQDAFRRHVVPEQLLTVIVGS